MSVQSCDAATHPHPEEPCGVRVETVTAASLAEFLRDCRPAVDLTNDQVDGIVDAFRRNGLQA